MAASLFFCFLVIEDILQTLTLGFKSCRSSRKHFYTLKIIKAALACEKTYWIALQVALYLEVYTRAIK